MNGTTLTRKSGPTTSWIVRRQNIWRVAILLVLLMLSPGFYGLKVWITVLGAEEIQIR
jgi:type II secretory pathway component PulL